MAYENSTAPGINKLSIQKNIYTYIYAHTYTYVYKIGICFLKNPQRLDAAK